MSKLLATVVGVFLAFSLSYLFLPEGFNAIVKWLAPVLGSPLRLVLSYLFLTCGNPISFPLLLGIWVAVGAVVGFTTCKLRSAALTASSIYSLSFCFLALALVHLIFTARNLKLSIESLPPTPPGLTLASMLNAPVIGDICQKVMNLISGQLDMGQVVNLLLSTVVPSIILNAVILVASAMVFAYIGRRVLKLVVER